MGLPCLLQNGFEFFFINTLSHVAGEIKNQIIMKKNHELKSSAKATTAKSFNQFKRSEISKVKQKSLKGGNDGGGDGGNGIIIEDVGDH